MIPFNLSLSRNIAFVLLILSGCARTPTKPQNTFVTIRDTHLEIGGKPYFFLGTNFWYGMNLGSKGKGGNRDRLLRELDSLKAMGVTNLRILAGSEGPDQEPYRMIPAMQTSPGAYNMDVVEGLDFLLQEMSKRDMRAVVCLANFWNWSGGGIFS